MSYVLSILDKALVPRGKTAADALKATVQLARLADQLGITAGMISSLVTRMPHHLAMEIMLLGTKVGAQRAYDVGFVNRVVPAGQQEKEATIHGVRVAYCIRRTPGNSIMIAAVPLCTPV